MEAGHQQEAAEIAERFFLGMASLCSLRAPVQPSFDLSGVDRWKQNINRRPPRSRRVFHWN